MYHGARDVKPLRDYRLLITFANDDQRVFDVKPYLNLGIFSELKQPGLFDSVRISFDTVEWDNGADLCPEVLYKVSVSVET